MIVAEEVGFEPTRAFRLAGLANLCNRPLCDSSKLGYYTIPELFFVQDLSKMWP